MQPRLAHRLMQPSNTRIYNGENTNLVIFRAQWKFSGDKHKSLQVYTERTFHQRYLLVML